MDCVMYIRNDNIILTDFDSRDPHKLAKANMLGIKIKPVFTKHRYSDIPSIVDRCRSVLLINAFDLVDRCKLAFNVVFEQIGQNLDRIYKITPEAICVVQLQTSECLVDKEYGITDIYIDKLDSLRWIYESEAKWRLPFLMAWHKMYHQDNIDIMLELDSKLSEINRKRDKYSSPTPLVDGIIKHEDNTVITHGAILRDVLLQVLNNYTLKYIKIAGMNKSDKLTDLVRYYNGKVLPIKYDIITHSMMLICDKDIPEEELHKMTDIVSDGD